MTDTTGKGMQGTFAAETGQSMKLPNFMMNCHKCGRSFSPVDATLEATNWIGYYHGMFTRLFKILEINSEVCEHLKEEKYICMYDNPDPMLGKIMPSQDISTQQTEIHKKENT